MRAHPSLLLHRPGFDRFPFRNPHSASSLLALLVASATPALAEPSANVSVLVHVGQSVSTGTTTRTVLEVRAVRALGPVSFATLLSTDRGDVIYGSFANDGLSSVLFAPQHGSVRDAGETLGRIEDHFGISANGYIAYSPLMARRPELDLSVPGMLDSVWRYSPSTDQNLLITRRGLRVLADPANATPPGPTEPLPYGVFGSFVGVTQLGTPFWLSGLSATPSGTTSERAVLIGAGTPRTLLRASDTLDSDGQVCTIGASGILSFSVAPSASALFALVSTECDGQTAEGLPTKKRLITRDVLTDNPGPLMQLMSEGDSIVQEVVTPTAGVAAGTTDGEKVLWIGELAIADSLACAGARRWAVAARSDAEPNSNSMIIADGTVSYREGQVLGGWTLIDEPVGLTLGQRGDLAFLWRARPDGNSDSPWQWVLFLNGSPITWSGQTFGTSEVERVYPKLAVGTRGSDGTLPVYAIARIKESGQSADALIRISGFSSSVCCPADIADDQGNPLPGMPGAANNGVNEGDYNAFFNGFFNALSYCDIADDQGNPLPGMPGVPNNGVNEGDFNCFFNFFMSGCN